MNSIFGHADVISMSELNSIFGHADVIAMSELNSIFGHADVRVMSQPKPNLKLRVGPIMSQCADLCSGNPRTHGHFEPCYIVTVSLAFATSRDP